MKLHHDYLSIALALIGTGAAVADYMYLTQVHGAAQFTNDGSKTIKVAENLTNFWLPHVRNPDDVEFWANAVINKTNQIQMGFRKDGLMIWKKLEYAP